MRKLHHKKKCDNHSSTAFRLTYFLYPSNNCLHTLNTPKESSVKDDSILDKRVVYSSFSSHNLHNVIVHFRDKYLIQNVVLDHECKQTLPTCSEHLIHFQHDERVVITMIQEDKDANESIVQPTHVNDPGR
ncbi:hypothetical protein PsorP6_000905 [Peronosclerospora sorghi]|uniref:Uncharacterized protein n=1 Tax=Peronosclerospora sorghi TaxID=230839 RepID=A0ACC0WRL0_9STRA|nr:hypothetical protein PsorP6_000905 [Peronosclerospora sorghi]